MDISGSVQVVKGNIQEKVMLNVKITVADNQVKIYLNEIIHLLIKQDQLVGIQSWTTGEEYKTYWIEYTLKTREILSGYEGPELWKAILMQLDQHQVLQFTDGST